MVPILLNSDWVNEVPFICPTQLSKQRNSTATICPHLLQREFGSLIFSSNVYQLTAGVPVLLPLEGIEGDEKITEEERKKFYIQHYGGRSRFEDLASDYLAHEREMVRHFIKEKKIRGWVLEIGCGTGIFADCSSKYIGMDYSCSSVFAEGFENFRRFVGDAQYIPLTDSSMEMVFSFNTLEHVPRPDLAFLEVDRVLAPGGYAILHPAWNCSFIQNRLIPVRSYSELKGMDKLVKISLPALRNRGVKFCLRVPRRLWRALANFGRSHLPLHYQELQPYMGSDVFIADCDACASIDVMDAILFFKSRGYECLSHPGMFDQVLSGHKPVVVRKP
ncbi:class I SAM-dependent methyltransferase [Prosthecobacter sp. SYSU 5D2]|uniref:class I SAM-dependent methyltransferase n=1 Tax=Prosthecobacter sp. SYSU 5D2 TaxID=3134134 RepID=UPI0031FE96D1